MAGISVLCWIASGALCGWLATVKGRRVGLWVVLGLLIGLIGVIIVACLPNLKNREQSSVLEGGRACPHCLSTVPAQAGVCRYCRREIPALATVPIER